MHGRMSHSTDVRSLIELWNQQSICRGVSHVIQLLILYVAYCVCVFTKFSSFMCLVAGDLYMRCQIDFAGHNKNIFGFVLP